jgi:2-keto-4-pentenoate hydratase
MRSEEQKIEDCACALLSAARDRKTIARLSDSIAGLDERVAYAIQDRTVALRASRPVGFKLGYTSAAMRAQMNIEHPNYGVLTQDMRIAAGSECVALQALIHPLVEPEIALVVGKDLFGDGFDRSRIYPYVDAVLPALEIVDTRYHDYRFLAVDNISDNSSGARFITGAPCRPAAVRDLRLLGVLLWSEGMDLDHGIGANALGDPLSALAWLANFLSASGKSIPAGSVVLTGGLTRAYALSAGQTFVGEFADLGVVKVHGK